MTVQPSDPQQVLATIRAQADAQEIRITQHAQREMVAEAILLDDLLQAIFEWTYFGGLSDPSP